MTLYRSLQPKLLTLSFWNPPKDWNKLNMLQWWGKMLPMDLMSQFKATKNLALIGLLGKKKGRSVPVPCPGLCVLSYWWEQRGWACFLCSLHRISAPDPSWWQRPAECGRGTWCLLVTVLQDAHHVLCDISHNSSSPNECQLLCVSSARRVDQTGYHSVPQAGLEFTR